jgi:hypothetical protein
LKRMVLYNNTSQAHLHNKPDNDDIGNEISLPACSESYL